MRLTNYLRANLVTAIMADVPRIDYKSLIPDAAMKAAISIMSPEAAKLYKTHPDWAGKGSVYVKDHGYVVVPFASVTVVVDAVNAAVKDLVIKSDLQNEETSAMRGKLSASFSNITNTKDFAQRFPDFAQYLPEDEKVVANLPATTEVMDLLAKSGWPKGKVPAPKAKAAQKAKATVKT